MVDLIVALAVLAVLAGAGTYVYRTKKRGKCVGCPAADTCPGHCTCRGNKTEA